MSSTSTRNPSSRTALAEAVGEQLARVVARARVTTVRAAARFHPDLPPAAFHVARWLSTYGAGRASDIADGVAMDRAAVSRLVAELRAAGGIRVDTDPSDRRASLISLTAIGRRHLAEAVQWKGEQFYDRLAGWSDRDLRELARLLAKLSSTGI